jgi:hypothetical protein
MSLLIDDSYVKMLNLEQLKETQPHYYNFRCPICGDSQKSKTKKRGWLIPSEDKQNLFFHCFNCSAAMNMSYFIHTVRPDLQKEYARENFKNNQNTIMNAVFKVKKEDFTEKIMTIDKSILGIEKITNLDGSHFARFYLLNRWIHSKYWDDIYYTENFKKWVNETYLPNKYQHITETDKRIVFPIHDINGKLIGFQGRSLDPNVENAFRFLTIKIIETDSPMYYGLNQKFTDDFINITEGIYDSLVINNSIAMLKLQINLFFLKQYFSNKKIIFVFDNEPRNKDVIRVYDKIANIENFGLFIWPKGVNVKDLNDLAKQTKWDQNQMTDFVKQNSVFGQLNKKLKLSSWKI